MCNGCWKKYGSPKIVNALVLKAATLVDFLCDPTSGCDGPAHVVIDDWNIDDESISKALDILVDGEDGFHSSDDFECLQVLKALPIEQRASALALQAGFFEAKVMIDELQRCRLGFQILQSALKDIDDYSMQKTEPSKCLQNIRETIKLTYEIVHHKPFHEKM